MDGKMVNTYLMEEGYTGEVTTYALGNIYVPSTTMSTQRSLLFETLTWWHVLLFNCTLDVVKPHNRNPHLDQL
jgi:hypothetical protein